MKRTFLQLCLLAALSGTGATSGSAFATTPDGAPVTIRFVDSKGASLLGANTTLPDVVKITGTGTSAEIIVESTGLEQDIKVSATSGFEVMPALIKVGSSEPTTVVVTNVSSRSHNTGKLILRSGDVRTYVTLESTGTPLPVKDISGSAAYPGGPGGSFETSDFAPGPDGYTVEVRARVSGDGQELRPYALSPVGSGFMGYVVPSGLGLQNGSGVFVSRKGVSNPSNGGTFYNTDGLYHTYRYAVTPDERVFVFRDGLAVDTLRLADLALQPSWSVENGPARENLLRNPGFEGEWDYSPSRGIVTRIEGWDVYPYDQYNSTQEIVSSERSNDVDQDNHALSMRRYMWSDGWSAGEVSQIVDVAPGEVYSFSALARGGIKKDGTLKGSLRIEDLQNPDNKVVIPVTGADWQTYASDFSTLADTRQVRVSCYLERDKWGASISALQVDDVRLSGVSRLVSPRVGFELDGGAEVAYFAYDATGAYAPMMPVLTAKEVATIIDSPANSADAARLNASVSNGLLTISDVGEGTQVMVYNAAGTLIANVPNYTCGSGIALPANGVYVVAAFKDGKRKVAKVRY